MTGLGTLLDGLYKAGQARERLGRELTDAEFDWFTNGWIPATCQQAGDYGDV